MKNWEKTTKEGLENGRKILEKKANELGIFHGTKRWKKFARLCEFYHKLATEYDE